MKRNILLAGLCLAMASCAEKEALIPEPADGMMNVNVTAEATRTVLDGVSVKWTSSDAIVLNGASSTAVSVSDGGKSAVFTVPEAAAPFYAVYPASAFVADSFDATASKWGSVNVSRVQSYTEGSFDPAAAVMVARQEAEGAPIVFNHAMSYIKFVISGKDDKDAIKSVTVETLGGEPLSGNFAVAEDGVSISASALTAAPVVLDCGEGAAQGKPVILAIPAGTYASGLQITVKDVNGHYQILKSTKEYVAAAAKIVPTEIDFAPTGTVVEGGICTAADWAEFAGKVAAGDDFAGKTITLLNDITVPAFFEYANGTFNGTFDGGNHTMTANANKWPLFATVGESGTVKNLTVAGKFTSFANPGQCGNAAFAKINLGTIEKCTGKSSVEMEFNSAGFVFGAICAQNGGILKDCVNEGNITVRVGLTSSGGLYGGGISALGHTVLGGATATSIDTDETCKPGSFINCTNKGNISLTTIKANGNDGAKPIRSGFGGICGLVYMNGVTFSGCVNEGDVSRISDGEASNNGSASVGGILGRSASWFITGSGDSTALDNGDVNGFNTSIQNCSNSGALLCQCRHSGMVTANASGARFDAVGGIAGSIIGKSGSVASIKSCHNTGNLSGGWNPDVNTTVLGGVAGFANYTDILGSDSFASLKAIDSDHPVGAAGGILGFARNAVNISGCTAVSDMDLYCNRNDTASKNVLLYGLAIGGVYGTAESSITTTMLAGSIAEEGAPVSVSESNLQLYIISHSSNKTPSINDVTWYVEP